MVHLYALTEHPANLPHVRGVDPSEPVTLVADGDLAAVASAVRLDEFGEAAIEDNLRDPGWLADKARAHDAVLAAAVGRTTVLPFRFGAIYRNEDHILELLTIKLRLLVASADKAREMGIDWWQGDPFLRSGSRNGGLEDRLERLERAAGLDDKD